MAMTNLERLATYISWPDSPPVSSFLLANSGFVYTGISDEVMCPLCDIVVGDWRERSLSPLDEHRLRSPLCLFFTESSSSNGTQHGGLVSSSTATSDINVTHTPAAGDSGSITPGAEIDRVNPDYDLLKYESARLSTFYDWPVSEVVQPTVLARAGFFYTGLGDRTRCAFCRGVLHHWEPTDDPDIEHFSFFFQCPFVRQRDVGNVPIQRDALQTNITQYMNNSLEPLTFQKATPTAVKSGVQKLDTNHANTAAGDDDGHQLHSIPMCKICMENHVNILFLPCRHLISCKHCAPRLYNCAICRTYIRGRIGIFLS